MPSPDCSGASAIARLEPQGLAAFGDALIELAHTAENGSEVVVSLGRARLEPHGLAELGDRLVELALFIQNDAELVVGRGQVRLDRIASGTRRWLRRACPDGSG